MIAVFLVGAVLAAVHHAEVVAHRVGEPFGSLVLAVAVTVIEVGLILTLMLAGGGKDTSTLARDTVFAAVMISCNGIVGLALLVGALRHHLANFNPEGTGSALATVDHARLGDAGSPALHDDHARAGVLLLAARLRGGRVAGALRRCSSSPRPVRHRDFFLPGRSRGDDLDGDGHADPPSARDRPDLARPARGRAASASSASPRSSPPSIERASTRPGFPAASVGVVIALLVLLPESIAAVRAAARDDAQTSSTSPTAPPSPRSA